MKKIEFLQELKNRGSITNAEEAQKAIDTWRNAGRGFDDDPVETSTQETPQPEQSKKESFLSKYEGGATKAFTEGAKRITEREQRWESPSTALGNAVYGKTGNATLATLAAVPERTVRLVGGAMGNVADIGYTAADVLSGGTLGKLMGQAAKIPGVATVAQKASQFAEAHPEAAKDLASLVDVAALAPAGAVAKGARSEIKTIAQESGKAAMQKSEEQFKNAIIKGVDKGIAPSVKTRGKTFSKSTAMYNNAESAVKSIVQNKDNINIVDKNGAIKTPKNYDVEDFANAIEQTKKNIYTQYHEMAVAAGKQPEGVDLSAVYKKLDEIAQKPGEAIGPKDVRKKYSQDLRTYAYAKSQELKELQGETPEIIEARIKELNNSLDGYYHGTTTKDKAAIDAAVATEMRQALDKSITDAMGEGYQDLKKQYGALTSIEKDVNHRATIVARKANKGLFDLASPFAMADIGMGFITLNPAQIAKGVAIHGVKNYYKSLNDPNRYIKNMFVQADKKYGVK